MPIEVRLFASLRDAVGQRTVTYDSSGDQRVRAVLAQLEADYPSLEGRLLDHLGIADGIVVLVNGRPVNHLDGEETTVTNADRISITLPISGGSRGQLEAQ